MHIISGLFGGATNNSFAVDITLGFITKYSAMSMLPRRSTTCSDRYYNDPNLYPEKNDFASSTFCLIQTFAVRVLGCDDLCSSKKITISEDKHRCRLHMRVDYILTK
jgi:hypothetical protein